jgi:hypothetical protein
MLTPLFSINSSLFLQNDRGGVSPLPIPPHIKDKTMKDKPSHLVSSARCQHRTATGRQCHSLVGDRSSELCPRHASTTRSPNFKEALTRRAYNFQRPQGVNNSLGVLYTLLAEGRISPRRASVLAYISSLLLRTLPAINDDNEHYVYDDEPSDPSPTPSSTPSAAAPQTPANAASAANGDDTDEEEDDDSANEDDEEESLDVEEEEDEEEEEDDAEDDGETSYAGSERASQLIQPAPTPPGRDPLPKTANDFVDAALKSPPAKI